MNVDYYSEYPTNYLIGNLIYKDLKDRKIEEDDIIQIIAEKNEDEQIRINIHENSEVTIINDTIMVKTNNTTTIHNLYNSKSIMVW